ncbi:putative periplasmic serine endoprotease DegP-like precursor [Variibacter gotjawalensis]|uniref:Probable periplasmic serine endoprotease DegP-like n=1 Tax=Variibacter gotjawalensis TaxID=1333996 RepID=A0A0S3PZ33_9BRAD|nr:Do family serine endopeptidase [Variibacter gotjawalensis]NIK47043.1 serine protease Do [Variibacter gotjawalensis]RZS48948.1 serine protease Do [Variibacter gotjawalensis]BAT61206.1 putative periplasmic serine endoprotease DegP-like precursor [Variibacter gotjawalensis]
MSEIHQARRKSIVSRGVAMLAAGAAIGALTIFAVPQSSQTNFLVAPAHAQALATRPASFADIVEKVKPAVFAVRVKVENASMGAEMDGNSPFPPGSPMERFYKRFGFGDGEGQMAPRGGGRRGEGRPAPRQFSMSQGSGFFISRDGYAVTNNHVVAQGASVEVKMDDGKTYAAKVIGTDPRTDLALLKVEGNNFPFVPLAEKLPRVGDWALAVGNPFGLGGTVTAGIVSANGRDIGAGPYDDFIQIDAPVNKGNSGGPTFDVDGNVIGVNTAIYSPSGGNVGIAFAIPADTVRSVVAQLKDKGQVSRGWIGVQIQPVTAEIAESLGLKSEQGALVADPQRDGPAAKAGIKSGDVIVSVNSQPVKDARDLAKKIGALSPGENVKVGVFRNGSETALTMKLGELPAERQQRAEAQEDREVPAAGAPVVGLRLAPAASVAGAGKDGVVVTEVEPSSPAAERGFKSGDVILEVAGAPVSSASEVRKALSDAKGKKSVLVRVKSGDSSRFVALPIAQG